MGKLLSIVNDPTTVDREQLFKHGALRDCSKKLALTVKMRSNSNQDFDDEYIPIEHVFDSASKKRIRLLNPYVLRMHWKRPIQAYQLTLTDTITGIVSDDKELKVRTGRNEITSKSNIEQSTFFIEPREQLRTMEDCLIKQGYLFTTDEIARGKESMSNTVTFERNKRNEYNILIEDPMHDENFDINLSSNKYKSGTGVDKRKGDHNIGKINGVEFRTEQISPEERIQSTSEKSSNYVPTVMDVKDEIFFGHKTKNNKIPDITHYIEEDFAMYNIENPDFWHTIGVQLYEKLTTSDGKNVWNDITKGKIGSVSSTKPDWTNKDNINVHYKSVEWIPKEKFALPAERLCVLMPLQRTNIDDISDDNNSLSDSKKECIVVPIEDVVSLKETRTRLDRRYENKTNNVTLHQRHVVIRTTRALTGEKFRHMNIVKRGFDMYLTVPHPGSYQAHLDLEVRADDNQLVVVGASGRINVVVSDNTRQTRASLTLQITNTGLAAARFRAAIRDYGPELAAIIDDKNFDNSLADPLLVPPRHTRRLHLEMPLNIPHDFQHFSVALVNDDEETVAIRNVTVKRGDRCFCVWHCECACLSDDPELFCHEMSESKQLAAGLSLKNHPRHTRSLYDDDVITINLFSGAVGLLLILLLLGFVKAILGLCFACIGSCGLHRIIQRPPNMDKYYENCLRSRRVVYDSDGWPVHPDTKQRTVRVISRSTEFLLNLIYFIMLPCIIIKDGIMRIWEGPSKKQHNTSASTDTKKCYSSRNEVGINVIRV